MKRNFFLVLCLAIGCGSGAADPENVGRGITTGTVIDYGNGVHYFAVTESDFGNQLSVFIAEYSELRIVTVAGDGAAYSGANVGFFVITRPASECK